MIYFNFIATSKNLVTKIIIFAKNNIMSTHTIQDIVNETRGKKNIPDFIVYIFLAFILFIDFLPHATAIDVLYSQFFYISILNLVFAVYFYLKKESLSDVTLLFKKSYIFWTYLAFVVISGISFIVARNSTLVLEKFIELIIGFCLFINLSILLRHKLHLIYSIILIVAIAAFFQSGIELYYLKQKTSSSSLVEALSLMAERAGNINILAASLTIKIPFLLIGIVHFKGLKKIFVLISLLFVTTVILLTAARASFINIILINIVFIAFYLKKHSFSKTSLVSCFSFIIPAVLAILIANQVFEKSKDNSRYVSLEDRLQTINTKDESVNARLLYWGNTVEMISKDPVLGIGLGNYKIESIPYEKTEVNDSMISLHTHNDFLEITAETGILNGIIYLSIFVFVVFINLKRAFKPGTEETQTIAILALMLSIVYGIDSLLNFPMFRPTMLIFFVLLLVLALINKSATDAISGTETKKIMPLVLIVTSLITIYFAFLGYEASLLEYKIKKDAANSFSTNLLTGDELIDELPKFKNTLSTAESFYEQVAIYYIHEKEYNKAFKYLSKAEKINPYFGRLFYHKMIIANARGNSDSAYIYAKQAYYLRPRNLNFFKMSTQFARSKNDTLELLKENKIFNSYRKLPEAWTITAGELRKTKYDHNKLIKFIDEGLKEFPGDSTLLNQKASTQSEDYLKEAQVFMSKNNQSKTLELYLKALKADPENVDACQNLAYYYYNHGDYKQSLTNFLKALKIKEFPSGRTEFMVGNCYLKMNDIQNSCKYFTISKSKNFPDAKKQLELNCK